MTPIDLLGVTVHSEPWSEEARFPIYLKNLYTFKKVTIGDSECVMMIPDESLASTSTLEKHMAKIRNISQMMVVLQLQAPSAYRLKSLIERQLPFMTERQVYLPFLGTYLENSRRDFSEITVLHDSTQLLFFAYLYANQSEVYVTDLRKQLSYSAMTITRAIKQLEQTKLMQTHKDGVRLVLSASYDRQLLFKKMLPYLRTPVRRRGYLKRSLVSSEMTPAGESRLSQESMLAPPMVSTYAIDEQLFKGELSTELIDAEEQVMLELWRYNPKVFNDEMLSDSLSTIVSLYEVKDERVEQAIDEWLKKELG